MLRQTAKWNGEKEKSGTSLPFSPTVRNDRYAEEQAFRANKKRAVYAKRAELQYPTPITNTVKRNAIESKFLHSPKVNR